jgi:kynurenine formamidase
VHHFNETNLRRAFQELSGSKASGIDRVTKDQYRRNFDANIEALAQTLRERRYRPRPSRQVLIKSARNRMKLDRLWQIASAKLQGHFNYFGVLFNSAKLSRFHHLCVGALFKWLNRRSQRRSFTWERFERRLPPSTPAAPWPRAARCLLRTKFPETQTEAPDAGNSHVRFWKERPTATSGVYLMTLLASLVDAISTGAIEVIDLTAPLSAATPILKLPEPFGNTWRFSLSEISHYNEAGPAWYWNNITTGEHTGTHLDAPIHWITGRDGADVSQLPPRRLIAPAAVLDFAAETAKNPDFLLEVKHVLAWQERHGPLPKGGWLLYRTGWSARANDEDSFLNGGHTPGISPECAAWLAETAPIQGVGVETVGTDAGAAHSFSPAFPCHSHLLGKDKYGLTQLQNLDRLPPAGAVVFVGPLPIVHGSGSPCRALALVERR